MCKRGSAPISGNDESATLDRRAFQDQAGSVNHCWDVAAQTGMVCASKVTGRLVGRRRSASGPLGIAYCDRQFDRLPQRPCTVVMETYRTEGLAWEDIISITGSLQVRAQDDRTMCGLRRRLEVRSWRSCRCAIYSAARIAGERSSLWLQRSSRLSRSMLRFCRRI